MIGAHTGAFAMDGQQFHSSCVLHEYLIGLGSLKTIEVSCSWKYSQHLIILKIFQVNQLDTTSTTQIPRPIFSPVLPRPSLVTAKQVFEALDKKLKFPEKAGIRKGDSAQMVDSWSDIE